MTDLRRYLLALACLVSAESWSTSSFSMDAPTPDLQSAHLEAPARDQLLGVGYHPGNFVGPLAFDVILRPLPHIAADLQAGYWSLENGVRGLALAPQLQWEFLDRWQTPYLGAAFRYEEVWSDGAKAASKGGFLVGGWQFRSRSGFGALIGVGALYMSSVKLDSTGAGYYASGGWYGTYEVGVRYFF